MNETNNRRIGNNGRIKMNERNNKRIGNNGGLK